MFTKITEERAFDGILAQIIENIRRGELKPGDTLPAERVMAESLGVSDLLSVKSCGHWS